MYFILKGTVLITHHETGLIYKELSDDSFFGDIGFFSRARRCAQAETITFVNIAYLDIEDFTTLPKINSNKEFEVCISIY